MASKEVIYEIRSINWFRVKAFIKLDPDWCFYCRGTFFSDDIRKRTKDHVIPRSRTAHYYVDYNKVNCCTECNSLKADLFPSEWRAKLIKELCNETDPNKAKYHATIITSLNQMSIRYDEKKPTKKPEKPKPGKGRPRGRLRKDPH